MFDLNYDDEKAGVPRRAMTVVDHTIAITDIAFSNDDTRLYTCALDGCIYEWRIGHPSRIGEYVYRGLPFTRVLVAPISGIVIASVEPMVDVTATNRIKMSKKNSTAMPGTPHGVGPHSPDSRNKGARRSSFDGLAGSFSASADVGDQLSVTKPRTITSILK